MSAHLLYFKPIFDPALTKLVKGASVSDGKCVSKFRSFSNACKNLGSQHP